MTDESQMEHGQLRDAAKTVGATSPVVNSGANSAANVKSESSRPRMREWALPVFLLRSKPKDVPASPLPNERAEVFSFPTAVPPVTCLRS